MNAYNAEMSEWFKEHDWKSCDAGTYPEVQILFSAPAFQRLSAILSKVFFCAFLLHTIFRLLFYDNKTRLKFRVYCKLFKLFALELVHNVRIDV